MKYRFIESKAIELLKQHGLYKAPVDVHKLVKLLNIQLEKISTTDNMSGFFLTKGSIPIIGYNTTESPERVRFTLGHEIGHYILHSKIIPLFIDKQERVQFNRDGQSSTGEQQFEREANAFAAALLMPAELLTHEVHSLDNHDGQELIEKLSKKFKVSTMAMSYRLANLELIEVGL
jgi:Zn-dependent peptidase ImmA (M78 family)